MGWLRCPARVYLQVLISSKDYFDFCALGTAHRVKICLKTLHDWVEAPVDLPPDFTPSNEFSSSPLLLLYIKNVISNIRLLLYPVQNMILDLIGCVLVLIDPIDLAKAFSALYALQAESLTSF